MRAIVLAAVLAVTCVNVIAAETCDCTIFPWSKQCDKQCGIASGKITSIRNGKLLLNVPLANGQGTATETFALTENSMSSVNSMQRAELAPDVNVTILFQKNADGAKTIKSIGRASLGSQYH
jgi:hypothetical protein